VTAQREFDLKEREYLAARKELAKCKQRKLLLTGHLDYIILTNERHKAQKLNELEAHLGMVPLSEAGLEPMPQQQQQQHYKTCLGSKAYSAH
jgi:hypothetical protein